VNITVYRGAMGLAGGNFQTRSQALLAGYKGQKHAERGFRFLKDPLFLASSLYVKKPQRMMALLMVMTVCLLVYAALE
jgi:transposase